MLTIGADKDGVLLVHVEGQLTVGDYAYGVARLAEIRDKGASAKGVLLELGASYTGWDVASLWRGLPAHGEIDATPRRVAVVGDDRWRDRRDESFIFPQETETRFFSRSEKVTAGGWLRTSDHVGAAD